MSNTKAGPAPTLEELKARFGQDIFRDFDYEDPKFNDTFFDVLDEQLAHCPVARSNVGHGYWWVSRNEDVRRVAQDWKTFSMQKVISPIARKACPICSRKNQTHRFIRLGAMHSTRFSAPKHAPATRRTCVLMSMN